MLENKFLGVLRARTKLTEQLNYSDPFIKKLEVRNKTKSCHIPSVLLDIIIYKYLNYSAVF